jgi:hypothetical protein
MPIWQLLRKRTRTRWSLFDAAFARWTTLGLTLLASLEKSAILVVRHCCVAEADLVADLGAGRAPTFVRTT